MPNIQEVADNIFWINTAIDGVKNTFAMYLIREPKGIIIEPGPTITLPLLYEAMERLEIKELAYIIPTHIHVDHAGGTGSLAKRFPDAVVVIHPRGVKHIIDPSRLIESTKTVWGEDFQNKFGTVFPVPKSRVKTPHDNEIISVNGRELLMIYTPGHAPHHMAVFDKESRSLFCGEALGMVGSNIDPFPLPAVAPPSFEQEQYLETINKLKKLNPQLLLFSHGGVVKEPEKIFLMASENAKVFGDIVLRAMQNGEDPTLIGSKVAKYASGRFGRELDETDLTMTVGGYAVYFKSKGPV